jgi:hypothetical protein
MISHEWAQRTSEISCSTREVNLVFPGTHVFLCLLYKGQSMKSEKFLQKSDNWKAIIFTCEIIINNLTCEIITFISAGSTRELTQGRILKDDVDFSTGCDVIFEVSMRRGRLEGVLRKSTPKIRYYKDVTLCENYVRDFFIAAILPVSVKFVI